jgi:hypothetical protein
MLGQTVEFLLEEEDKALDFLLAVIDLLLGLGGIRSIHLTKKDQEIQTSFLVSINGDSRNLILLGKEVLEAMEDLAEREAFFDYQSSKKS